MSRDFLSIEKWFGQYINGIFVLNFLAQSCTCNASAHK